MLTFVSFEFDTSLYFNFKRVKGNFVRFDRKSKMADKKPLKILAVGDIKGQFGAFFKRITSVNAKAGPFEMVLCVGDFFGINEEWKESDADLWKEIRSGKTKSPVPIYLLGPLNESQRSNYPDIEGCEMAEDILYLGKAGNLTTSNGLKIAYISPGVDFETVRNLEVRSRCDESGFHGVDILLSSDWPKGIAAANESQGAKSDRWRCI